MSQNNHSTTVSDVKFNSFVVLDLETSNFISDCNNGSKKGLILEISMYGISREHFLENCSEREQIVPKHSGSLPTMPRLLQKLTMVVKPDMDVHSNIAKSCGLTQNMVEHELPMNRNVTRAILGFMQHLQQPVCLVAHNGWTHDFPIVKQTFAKLKKQLPIDILCVDSLRAFLEIDDVYKSRENTAEEADNDLANAIQNLNLDTVNIIEPNRPIRQSLTFGANASPVRKRYPPKGVYRLQDMYRRIFLQEPMYAHRAEADVESLLLLMLHYGEDFVDYALQHARPLTEVPMDDWEVINTKKSS